VPYRKWWRRRRKGALLPNFYFVVWEYKDIRNRIGMKVIRSWEWKGERVKEE